ncbi:helix-turn-helix domain-containing protein [Paenibacillus filicis]|uniref:Helix-turn-helix domain-containing protein n=1 Tax=Paenibacillus gyeongsangnamensis TaxID=3388067 RepID=A0ABT4Q2I2_9BACL|nr:helix-turn-helix domain-containing protein [Paenibacillus filicis]MCZ8511089.1 helix-turn-helix domain-containing protein [Paenibacillus filicis]
MIKATTDVSNLPLYEALASEVRLRILRMLAERPMNIKEIAQQLELSSAIVTMHIRKLEAGGLISTQMVRKEGGTHKMCTLAAERIQIDMPLSEEPQRKVYESSIPIGHYTAFDIHPTCGLVTKEKVIGQFDDPRYFLEPERMYAHMLWFGKGYVEYRIPNYLLPGQRPEEIEIAMELGSEAPGANDNWPSDISFYLNGVPLGEWTSPGDFGSSSRGTYTPEWWRTGLNQYGHLKVIRVREEGTFIDGQRVTGTKLSNLPLDRNYWTLRIAVEEGAEHVGGLTLYGEGFGNYNQDVLFRVYYR